MSYDKRKFQRFRSIVLNVEFKHNTDRNFSSVEIADVSTGGLCFLTNTHVMIDDNLVFRFSIGFSKILMSGKIARINGREVGVEFTNSEDEVRTFINTYNMEVSRITKEFPEFKNKHMISSKTEKSLKSDSIGSMLEIDL